MNTPTIVLSCDWFSYSCYIMWSAWSATTLRPAADKFENMICQQNFGEYKAVKSVESNPLFMCSLLVKKNDMNVCHLFFGSKQDPKKRTGIAKVDNSMLYRQGWADEFTKCLRVIGWRIVATKRVDVCADFELFANGRKPLQFIKDYLHTPTTSRQSFVRKSSNQYRTNGVRSTAANIINTISWGTRDSPVQVNLYNKTQELADKTCKPWIIQKWEANGLQSGVDSFGHRHWVWRLEFSLNCQQIAFRSKNKSSVRNVSLSDVCDQAALVNTFRMLVPNYFQFYYLAPDDVAAKRKVKDLMPVDLFALNDLQLNEVPMTLNRTLATGRTERLLAKRLDTLLESSAFDTKTKEALIVAKNKFTQLAYIKDHYSVSDAEDVLAAFIYGLTTSDGQKVGKWSRELAEHHAKRFAKLLRCASSQMYADYEWACEALQDDVEHVRAMIAKTLEEATLMPEDDTPLTDDVVELRGAEEVTDEIDKMWQDIYNQCNG